VELIFPIRRDFRGVPAPERDHCLLRASLDDARLVVQVQAPFHDDPPPPGPPGRYPRLWEHEVVELFLLGEGERYTEIEVGPHGHHLALNLLGRRHVVDGHVRVKVETRIDGARWSGRAEVSRSDLPERCIRANAYAMFGSGVDRQCLAAHPVPGEAPDFHRLECFPPIDDFARVSPRRVGCAHVDQK
jgi:hypothetical protein